MNEGDSKSERPPADIGGKTAFSQTHWTTVLHAQGSSAAAQEALNRLCCRYWPPVYAFIRRQWKQHTPEKAEDLTQGFFAEFIRRFPSLEISAEKGKFRTYVLACLTHFLCKDWERGRRPQELVISPEEIERAVGMDGLCGTECAPQRAFDIVWANRLVEKALDNIRAEYVTAGKAGLFEGLVPLLTERAADGAYIDLATKLGTTEGTRRVATHQFRRRFGEVLRAEVAQTVARPEETDEELRYLLSLWGANRNAS